MKKIFLTIAFIASGLVASAQVGVGTENPQTSLHIVGANATDKGVTGANVPGALAATDGITVPVVTTEMTAPGTPVAGTRVGQMVYSNFAGKTGFYYWDGTTWVAVAGAQAAVPYQNIRGSVATVASATYTVLPSDHVIITNHNSGVTVTLPELSVAETGRLIYIVNNNTGAFANTINAQPTALPFGNGMNQFRGRCYVWTGTRWLALAQA